MLFTYDGIVVGRRDIGESNCFLDILTDEQGIVEATAHGVKKINSSLLGSCGLFSYSTFCLNKTKMRYTVNSAKPKRSFHEQSRASTSSRTTSPQTAPSALCARR